MMSEFRTKLATYHSGKIVFSLQLHECYKANLTITAHRLAWILDCGGDTPTPMSMREYELLREQARQLMAEITPANNKTAWEALILAQLYFVFNTPEHKDRIETTALDMLEKHNCIVITLGSDETLAYALVVGAAQASDVLMKEALQSAHLTHGSHFYETH
jgi:hypothetical protein